MVICLERGADLHMAQLMLLPLTVSCFSKIQIGFTFLLPAHPGSPGQRVVKWVCVRVFFVTSVLFVFFYYYAAFNMPCVSRKDEDVCVAFSSRLGYEEHIPGQTRDWNEELQTTRELPRKHLPERLIRERTIFKVHSDFVVAATRGAMSVIDGNIMAINPGEDTK